MPLDYSQMAIPKPKKHKKKTEPAKPVYQTVYERDGGHCQFPGCFRTDVNHHHIILRSQGGKNHIENLVLLCQDHHTMSKESPHQSEYWRRYWENRSRGRYPAYWEGVDKERGKRNELA